ncbi:MAG: 50S ribosomal protein L10 [Candidatus Anstonellales archaeon]
MEERKSIKEKMQEVEALLKEMKHYKGFMLLDLRKTPAVLQQKIRGIVKHDLKGNMKAVKKAVITKALMNVGIKEEINYPAAIILADAQPYNLYTRLNENKLEVSAKPGDIAPFDIIVPAGETDLQPGPALSQLKAAGLNVKIEKGKIVVAKDSIVVKKGEVITQEKAQALQMLGIKPFKVGINVTFAYDGILYTNDVLSISKEQIADGIFHAIRQARNASINTSYPSTISIKEIMINAIRQAKNASVNANIYSDTFIKDLLIKSIREAYAVEKRVAQ